MGRGDSSEIDSDDEYDEKAEPTPDALYEMGMLSLLEKIVATDPNFREKPGAGLSSDFNRNADYAGDDDNGDAIPGEAEDALDKDDEDEYEEEEFVYKEIDNSTLTKQEKEDLRTITGLVEKMVEVVSFRHALYMNPGITDWLHDVQHVCWENKIRLDEESLSIDASRKAEHVPGSRHKKESPREGMRGGGGASASSSTTQAHAGAKRSNSVNASGMASIVPRGSSGSSSERSGGGGWQAEVARMMAPVTTASSSGTTEPSSATAGVGSSSRVNSDGCSPLSPPGGGSPSLPCQWGTAIPHLPMLHLSAHRNAPSVSGGLAGLPPVAPGSRPHHPQYQLHHLPSAPHMVGYLYREPQMANYQRMDARHDEDGAEDTPFRMYKQRFPSAPGLSGPRGSTSHAAPPHIHVPAPLPSPASTLSAHQRNAHMACMKTPYGVNNPGAVTSTVITSYPNANPYLVSNCQSMALQRRVIEIARLQGETMKLEKRKKRRQRHRASLNDIHHRAVNKG